MQEVLRVAVAGAGRRVREIYGPILGRLSDQFAWVSVWSRRPESAEAVSRQFDVPHYDGLDEMVEKTRPDLLIVSVNYAANDDVGLAAARLGVALLLETPIAVELSTADGIINAAERRGIPVEVAEQYHLRPMEQLKLALLRAGIFGRVAVACNDFMGHGYHGMSLIRSYLGLGNEPIRVTAYGASLRTAPHYAWIGKSHGPREEAWQQAQILCADGGIGVFSWSDISYDSPLRWQRATRFFGAHGMAVGDEMTLLSPDGRDPRPVRVERRFHNVGGEEVLTELIARTEPEVRWVNPLRGYCLDDELLATALCLHSLAEAVRAGVPPNYGARQARKDQELVVAMEASIARRGEPVDLPLKTS